MKKFISEFSMKSSEIFYEYSISSLDIVISLFAAYWSAANKSIAEKIFQLKGQIPVIRKLLAVISPV